MSEQNDNLLLKDLPADIRQQMRFDIIQEINPPGSFWYDFFNPNDPDCLWRLLIYFPIGRLIHNPELKYLWEYLYRDAMAEHVSDGEDEFALYDGSYGHNLALATITAIFEGIKDFDNAPWSSVSMAEFGGVFFNRVRRHFQNRFSLRGTPKKDRKVKQAEMQDRVQDFELDRSTTMSIDAIAADSNPYENADYWELIFNVQLPWQTRDLFLLNSKFFGYDDESIVMLVNLGEEHWHTEHEKKLFPLILGKRKKITVDSLKSDRKRLRKLRIYSPSKLEELEQQMSAIVGKDIGELYLRSDAGRTWSRFHLWGRRFALDPGTENVHEDPYPNVHISGDGWRTTNDF